MRLFAIPLLLGLATSLSGAPLETRPAPTAVKFFVDQDRLYRVTGHDLAAAGVPMGSIRGDAMNLYTGGTAIPIVIDRAGDNGAITQESAIVFWGQFARGAEGREDLFTRENAYTLVFNDAAPPRRYVAQAADAGTGAAPRRVIPRTAHLERDSLLLYRQRYVGFPTDRTMWRAFQAPPRLGAHVTLDSLPDLAPGTRPRRLRAFLWGTTYLVDNPDHDWTAVLNGSAIGSVRWDGTTHAVFTSDSIDAAYRHGPNRLAFRNNMVGDKIDGMLLDWVEIDYVSVLAPRAGFLAFGLAGGGQALEVVDGFSGAARAFEVRSGVELELRKGKGNLALTTPAVDSSHVAMAGPAGYAKPNRMLLDHPHALKAITRSPEYLLITHADFMEAARPLVQRRRAQGLDAMQVDVDDVYDEYSHGRFTPEAIRAFIDDLLERQGGGKGLRYVFLVGDATCDFKNVAKDSRNFVPTYNEVEEGDLPDYMPIYPRDDYFVYGRAVGKRIPKAAIGRLPCHTVAELQHFIDKLVELEDSPVTPDSTWARRAVLIGAEGFGDMCNDLAGMREFKGWEVDTVRAKHGDVKGNTALQNTIVSSLSRGSALTYFVGHGALLRWRTGPFDPNQQTDLFTKEHMATVTNQGRYPVVMTSTCYSAMFDNPIPLAGSDAGIGVYMVLAEKKGAIACIGHVAKTSAGAAQAFSAKTMQELFSGSSRRLGDAYIAAKTQYFSHEWAGIALIGDPGTDFGKRYAGNGPTGNNESAK